jgi:hypothetical protein
MSTEHLVRFLAASNAIEDIRGVTDEELAAAKQFLGGTVVSPVSVSRLASHLSPPGVLRTRPGLDVYVGDHIPPRGGPEIRDALGFLLNNICALRCTPWQGHVRYLHLHPLTDGNGRTSRLIWLWHMRLHRSANHFPAEDWFPEGLGFLHEFYYQTLESTDRGEHR